MNWDKVFGIFCVTMGVLMFIAGLFVAVCYLSAIVDDKQAPRWKKALACFGLLIVAALAITFLVVAVTRAHQQ